MKKFALVASISLLTWIQSNMAIATTLTSLPVVNKFNSASYISQAEMKQSLEILRNQCQTRYAGSIETASVETHYWNHKAVSIATCKFEATPASFLRSSVAYAVYSESTTSIDAKKQLMFTAKLKQVCQSYGGELLEETADSGFWGSMGPGLAIGLCSLR